MGVTLFFLCGMAGATTGAVLGLIWWGVAVLAHLPPPTFEDVAALAAVLGGINTLGGAALVVCEEFFR